MRRGFIKLLILLVVAALVSDLIQSDPGYLLIEYKTWMVETSLATLVLLSLTGLLLALIARRLIRPILNLLKKSADALKVS